MQYLLTYINSRRRDGTGKPTCVSSLKRNRALAFNVESLERRQLLTSYFVSTSGSDTDDGSAANPFRTIQHALDVADDAGDEITVAGGTYREKVAFQHSGSEAEFITLQAATGQTVKLDGAGIAGDHIVLIEDLSYLKLIGFELLNNQNVTDGSGVRIQGSGTGIEIIGNTIHDMSGENAMGVTVYGTERQSLSNIVIHQNHIYDLESAPSEALTLNGNVERFEVTDNLVHDVNSIGIDAIGGERDIQRVKRLVARDGVIRGNTVYNARSNYEGGFGAGIYVDGGRDIIVENNEVYQSDLGIEIGAENRGVIAKDIIVRNNVVHHNDKAGIVVGGYERGAGRVKKSLFYNNTVVGNDTLDEGLGQLWIQFANRNTFVNNIFVAGENDVLTYSEKGNRGNVVNHNLWYTSDGSAGEFTWRSETVTTFSEFQAESRQSESSVFDDPKFVNAAANNYHLQSTSAAIDIGLGDDDLFAPTDFDGNSRPIGDGIDVGAFEFDGN